MIIGWASTKVMFFFCADQKFKMAAIGGHSFYIRPYGENVLKISSLKSVYQFKANIAWMVWMDLYKSYVFCADWKVRMAAISGHSFIIGRYEEKCVKIFCSGTS